MSGTIEIVAGDTQAKLALHELERPAEAAVAQVLPHGQHVRVDVGVAVAQARQSEVVGDHDIAVKGGKNVSADFFSDDEHAHRHQLGVVKSPDLFLQGHHLAEVAHGVAGAQGQSAE